MSEILRRRITLRFYSHIERSWNASIDSTVLQFKFPSLSIDPGKYCRIHSFVRYRRSRSENTVVIVIIVVRLSSRKMSRVALDSWSTTLATINKTAPSCIDFRRVSPVLRSRGFSCFFFYGDFASVNCRSQSRCWSFLHTKISLEM